MHSVHFDNKTACCVEYFSQCSCVLRLIEVIWEVTKTPAVVALLSTKTLLEMKQSYKANKNVFILTSPLWIYSFLCLECIT